MAHQRPQITAETRSNWMTPAQAVEFLNQHYDDRVLAIQTLQGRLSGGVIQALSANSVRETGGRTVYYGISGIPKSAWKDLYVSDNVWKTGDLTYMERTPGGVSFDTMRHYDVRLDPDAVRAIIQAISEVVLDGILAPEPLQKGPTVSPAHLQEWFNLYRKVYTGAADTEPNALNSAKGMFPGKSVSRETVRKLRGSQKPGPKGPRNSSE